MNSIHIQTWLVEIFMPTVQLSTGRAQAMTRDAVGDSDVTLTGRPGAQTVKIYVIAANDARQMRPGYRAQIAAPGENNLQTGNFS